MKNTMSLENYGVVEMTTREMETTNGGCWYDRISKWVNDFIDGFNAGSGAEC